MFALDFKPQKDEEVLKILKTHPKVLAPYILLFVILMAIQVAIVKFVPSMGPLKLILSALLSIVQLIYVIYPILKWKTTYYVITSKRVMTNKGIFTRNIEELPCNYMGRIKVERGFLDMIFGCGTIRIFNPSDVHAGLKFDDVPRVKEVRDILDKLSNFGEVKPRIDDGPDFNNKKKTKRSQKTSFNENSDSSINKKVLETTKREPIKKESRASSTEKSATKISSLNANSEPGIYEIFLSNKSSYEIEVFGSPSKMPKISLNKDIGSPEEVDEKTLRVSGLDLVLESDASFVVIDNKCVSKEIKTNSKILKINKVE